MTWIEDDERSERLRMIQHDLFERNIPVLVLVEGPGGKIMGRIVNEIINLLEPRGVEYHHFPPNGKEKSPRNAVKFLESSPAGGRFAIFDRGWYSQFAETLQKDKNTYEKELMKIIKRERFLTNNGTILVKIYLNSEDDLDLALGGSHMDCGELVDDTEFKEIYNAYHEPMCSVIKKTSTVNAEWNIIDVGNREDTIMSIVDVLLERLTAEPIAQIVSSTTKYENPRNSVDLSAKLKEDYDEILLKRSVELAKLQCKLAGTKRSLILVFEGWDASGKGGSIKRLARALNPRGYRAVPIGVPTDEERSHNYLWRFCDDLPDNGKITIFDRSWYGRMLIEKVEGFCTEEEYARSYSEINNFELALKESGAIIMKFWMEISKGEQIRRFREREGDPIKNWKITKDDWKNRSKWNSYEKYINNMMTLTNTPDIPWTVIESEDKKYARIKVIETVINILKKELK